MFFLVYNYWIGSPACILSHFFDLFWLLFFNEVHVQYLLPYSFLLKKIIVLFENSFHLSYFYVCIFLSHTNICIALGTKGDRWKLWLLYPFEKARTFQKKLIEESHSMYWHLSEFAPLSPCIHNSFILFTNFDDIISFISLLISYISSQR